MPSDTDLPFEFKRRQFPLRLAFAMSIKKAQGQTFRRKVGLYLLEPVFSHGQLYVAMSRVCSFQDLSVMGDDLHPDREGKHTRNIVYTEVFDD